MIKIIDQVFIRSLDVRNAEFVPLAFVPASAVAEITRSNDDGGDICTVSLSAVVPFRPVILRDNLAVRIFWDSRRRSFDFGTVDLPVRFDVSEGDKIEISAKYKCPESLMSF